MSDKAITVENLSKAYRIGLKEQKHETMTGAIMDWIKQPLHNLRRVQNLTRVNLHEDSDDTIWALKDVSFEVRQGEVIGIIGRNGAGKSTLLKVLSRITEPTAGRIVLRGKLSSLLEVGTGFHRELTGRENVYLNGAILGMRKKEIDLKFDEIIDFSGVEKFLDTPVKKYSSGMQVRLAFSVAAHLEPDILMIDEVLAVGDAEFQKKCLGKMRDVAGHGRTVLFVSHNMASMKNICSRAILMETGEVIEDGDIRTVVNHYLARNIRSQTSFEFNEDQHRYQTDFRIVALNFLVPEQRLIFQYGESVSFELKIQCKKDFWGVRVGVGIVSEGVRVSTIHSHPIDFLASDSLSRVRCTFPRYLLLPGIYSLVLGAHLAKNGQGLDYINQEMYFEISEVAASGCDSFDVKAIGIFKLEAKWENLTEDRQTVWADSTQL